MYVLENRTDPDEILHSPSFNLDLHHLPKDMYLLLCF